MSARLLAIESDKSLSGSGRMVLGIVESMRAGLAAAGAPLTPAQESVLAELETQVRTWSA